MRKNSVRLIICIMLVSVGVMLMHQVMACVSEPDPAYKAPPYVDLGYDAFGESQPNDGSDPNPSDHFDLLLGDYAKATPVHAPVVIDDYQASRSARDKPYRDAIDDLLKSRNIDPASVTLLPPGDDNQMDSGFFDFAGGCVSDTKENALAFMQAAFRDPAVKNGYADLVRLRDSIRELCVFKYSDQPTGIGLLPHDQEKASFLRDIAALKTKPGTGDYPAYLEALVNFYDYTTSTLNSPFNRRGTAPDNSGHYRLALNQFEKLSLHDPAIRWWQRLLHRPPAGTWLQQTSMYMLGRIHLILSQTAWDGESAPADTIDHAQLISARDAFAAYLKAYPQGLYARSAVGLERKMFYLEGRQDQLDPALREVAGKALQAGAVPTEELAEIDAGISEFKHFYKGSVEARTDPPLLVAYEVILSKTIPADTLGQIDERHSDFDKLPGLRRFLTAYILYRQHDYQGLIDRVPEEPVEAGVASLSAAALRADALDNLGRPDEAFTQWKAIASIARDDQSQLHVAGYYSGHKDYKSLFGPGSAISNPHVLEDFGFFAVPDEPLESLLADQSISADNRNLIKQILFRRYLLQRNLSAIDRLAGRNSDQSFDKDALSLARKLLSNPNDAAANVGLGEYLYEHYLKPDVSIYIINSPFNVPNVLAELKPHCPECQPAQNAVPPFDYFLTAYNLGKESTVKSDTQAKNLYYLVRCFRGQEFQDRCKWLETRENLSKQWFGELHRKYPQSIWAAKTPFYYSDPQ